MIIIIKVKLQQKIKIKKINKNYIQSMKKNFITLCHQMKLNHNI